MGTSVLIRVPVASPPAKAADDGGRARGVPHAVPADVEPAGEPG
jgi:hypothetical protein